MIVRMVDHVRKTLGIDPGRVHAVAVGKTSLHDIFEPIVFRKKSPFASATYVRSSLLRTSIPSEAKKKMGVLAYDWEPGPRDWGGVKDFLDRLRQGAHCGAARRHASEVWRGRGPACRGR